jgi:predicted ABC-type transport system involved in lysophospholipase L1 biosynthesis ATPase subunit
MSSYLKIDHVDKVFSRGNRETEVLKDIMLTVEKGEYVSIIGHSTSSPASPRRRRAACSWKIRK